MVDIDKRTIESLNVDIELFPQVFPITDDMKTTHEGVSRLIMLDRYAFKDTEKNTLKIGDIVVVTAKADPKFPTRVIGQVVWIEGEEITVELEEQYAEHADTLGGKVTRHIDNVDKPLELFYEQIARRNARGLAAVEPEEKRAEVEADFYEILSSHDFIPGGRVIYGAGSRSE